MEIRTPYGKGEKSLHVPPEVHVDFLVPREIAPVGDLGVELAGACKRPVAGAALDEMIGEGGTVVILVSDLTRAGGAEVVLPACLRLLGDLGVEPVSTRIIVARGTHRKLTKSEKEFFRKGAVAGVTFEEHDCDDSERLSALLLTHRGTPVRVNLALKDAGLILILAPVSFHYFAGFGGGRKLVLPGCADRQSILANHRLSLVDAKPVTLHPNCRPGVLEGNPVHEDMCETLGALNRVFAVNFFANAEGDVVYLNAGDPIKSHNRACEAYDESHSIGLESQYDVVVLSAGGFPNDINLVQSHKALRHVSAAVKEGGTVLFYAECEEGIGSDTLEAALQSTRRDFLKTAFDEYGLNNQTAVSLYELADKLEIGMISAMNVDVLLSVGIQPCVDAEAFLAEALEKHGANKIAVIQNGNGLLPRFEPGGRR